MKDLIQRALNTQKLRKLKSLDELYAEIDQLQAALATRDADAERYRIITDLSSKIDAAIFTIVGENCEPKHILDKDMADALIDATIKEQP